MASPELHVQPDVPANWNDLRDVGDQAVWSVSSCKQGYGVRYLRDGDMETYWQCVSYSCFW